MDRTGDKTIVKYIGIWIVAAAVFGAAVFGIALREEQKIRIEMAGVFAMHPELEADLVEIYMKESFSDEEEFDRMAAVLEEEYGYDLYGRVFHNEVWYLWVYFLMLEAGVTAFLFYRGKKKTRQDNAAIVQQLNEILEQLGRFQEGKFQVTQEGKVREFQGGKFQEFQEEKFKDSQEGKFQEFQEEKIREFQEENLKEFQEEESLVSDRKSAAGENPTACGMAVGSCQDMIDAMWDMLQKLGMYFLVLKERLETEENSTKALITDISHQLKTPIAALRIALREGFCIALAAIPAGLIIGTALGKR